MTLPKIYLASKSPRRREILSNLNIPFECIESPYKEDIHDGDNLSPEDLVTRLACLKALYAAKTLQEGLVIGADTIVVLDDEVLGKPKDRADAYKMIHELSGRKHHVITAIAIVNAANKQSLSHAETTAVFFQKLSEKDIEAYLDTPEPYDKAGAYGIQGHAGLFVEKIEGCYFNVVGFPVSAFGRLMKLGGYDLNDYIAQNKKS